MSKKSIKTKYGNASISTDGYYRVTSVKEGNFRKLLHRLIIEDFYNIELPLDWSVHHLDMDKLNNHIWNLMPMPKSEHQRFHSENISDETRKKRSLSKLGSKNPMYKYEYSDDKKQRISKFFKELWSNEEYASHMKEVSRELNMGVKNPQAGKGITGFLRVTKNPCKTCKQGFSWRYRYTLKNGKRISFVRQDLFELKELVLDKGYEWVMINEDNALNSICENNKWFNKNNSLIDFL